MNSFLECVKASVNKRVALLPDIPLHRINHKSFMDIFKARNMPVVISEIKFASPSRGLIYFGEENHVQIAKGYLHSGASAISVLTEPNYFRGNVSYIHDLFMHCDQPQVLMKDFIMHPKQLKLAVNHGATAILLMTSILDDNTLKTLYDTAIAYGLTPIVEVHDELTLARANDLAPMVIGVNNRNLHTLEVDLNTAKRLIKNVPDQCVAICESGLSKASEIKEMLALGYEGFLIGSSLMSQSEPDLALKKLLAEVADET
ncbi:MAG: indole-3-glycerol-phosphate synthase [Gammaproteobacteria bacterium]|nr:indole-3-glycerol-phosphate synthase [Gammaproteobacteria bacterium]